MCRKPLHISLVQTLLLLLQLFQEERRRILPSQTSPTLHLRTTEGRRQQTISKRMCLSRVQSIELILEMILNNLIRKGSKLKGRKQRSPTGLKDAGVTKKSQRESGNNWGHGMNKSRKTAGKNNLQQIKKLSEKRKRTETCTFEITPAPSESRPVLVDALHEINALDEDNDDVEVLYAAQEEGFFCHVTEEEMFKFDSCGPPSLLEEMDQENEE